MHLLASCKFCLLAIRIFIFIAVGDIAVKNSAWASEWDAKLTPEIRIPQGTLQGITLVTRHNRSISAFLGIPYAQPPTGDLRFRSPVSAGAWEGTLDASVERAACLQPENVGKEDCLYLNVYTPLLPHSDNSSLLSVMVFIHGGGFESGNGGLSIYGPNYLLDANVVLISINYRLGPLGFLSTGDEVASGNWGLKDQVLALKWVQANIAYFGGDPDRVTIFGHSAGGASVQFLAMSKSTIGLFHQFISQSGAAYGLWTYRPRSSYANVARQLGEILGCRTHTSTILIACLRELNASDIIATRPQLLKWYNYPIVLWGPTDEPDFGEAFLTDTPSNLLAAGKVRDLPSMTGIAKDDGLNFVPGILPDSHIFEELLNDFDHLLPIVLFYSERVTEEQSFTAALKKFYFNDDLTTNRTRVWSNCVALFSDSMLIYPVYNALQKQLNFAKNSSFFYFFDYHGTYSMSHVFEPDGTLLKTAVAHSDDLLYLFPQTNFISEPDKLSETDLRMIDTMVQLWTSFAINGTPTVATAISNATWLPYSSKDNYLRIGSGANGTLELRYNFVEERMQFWRNLTATGSGNRTTSFTFL